MGSHLIILIRRLSAYIVHFGYLFPVLISIIYAIFGKFHLKKWMLITPLLMISIVIITNQTYFKEKVEAKVAASIYTDSAIVKKVDKNIYVDVLLKDKGILIAKNYIKVAKKLNTIVYGSLKSNPTWFVCVRQECYDAISYTQLAKKTAGTATRADYIKIRNFIGTKKTSKYKLGLRTMGHELSHAELYKRVYSLGETNIEVNKKIPTWFQEGLAGMVGQSAYGKCTLPNKSKLIDHLKSLDTGKEWHANLTSDSYCLAKKIVTKWYKKVGQKGLLTLIDQIKKGNKFDYQPFFTTQS